MMNIALVALLSISGDPAVSVQRLLLRGAGVQEVREVAQSSGGALVPAVADALRSRPGFAPGTRPANLAVEAVASITDADGRLSLTTPGQIEVMIDALEWCDVSTRLTVIQALRFTPEHKRAFVGQAIADQIHHPHHFVVASTLDTLSHVGIPGEHVESAREFARNPSTANPAAWDDAVAWDRRTGGSAADPKGSQVDIVASALTALLATESSRADTFASLQSLQFAPSTASIMAMLYRLSAEDGPLRSRDAAVADELLSALRTHILSGAGINAIECCAIEAFLSVWERAPEYQGDLLDLAELIRITHPNTQAEQNAGWLLDQAAAQQP